MSRALQHARATLPARGSCAGAGQAGFTLIEVMVTLLVMGLILTSMSMILDSARKSRDTIYNIQETQLAGPAIMDLIERDLRGLLTYNRDPNQALRVVDRVLIGRDADSLDFISTTDSLIPILMRDRFVRGDINEVGYRCRENPENDDFLEIYRREDLGIDDEPLDGGQYTFLHDRVRRFDVQIYTEDGPDGEPIDEWGPDAGEEERGLPTRIEIELELELSPRVVREQLTIAPIDKRRIVYKRVIRFPEVLRASLPVRCAPAVPSAEPDSAVITVTGDGSGDSGNASGPR